MIANVLSSMSPAVCKWASSIAPAASSSCRNSSSLSNHSVCVSSSSNDDMGFCFDAPSGGLRSISLDSGRQVVYFPLTASSTSRPSFTSWPFGSYKVKGGSISRSRDTLFTSSVLVCNGASTATISNPPTFASNGSFGISLWFKYEPSPETDPNPFLYLLSQGSSSGQEVGLFLFGPPKQNLSGLARAILRDGRESDSDLQFFLNSDGSYSADSSLRSGPLGGWGLMNSNLLDSAWHHIVLSTSIPSTNPGFVLFLDGIQVASIPSLWGVSDPAFPSSPPLKPGGGRPLNLTTPLTLCGRFTGNPMRTFSGSLAQLTLFDSPLTNQEVVDLWSAGLFGTRQPISSTSSKKQPTLFDGISLPRAATARPSPPNSTAAPAASKGSVSNINNTSKREERGSISTTALPITNSSTNISIIDFRQPVAGNQLRQDGGDDNWLFFTVVSPIIATVFVIAILLGGSLYWKRIRSRQRSRVENDELLRGVASSSQASTPQSVHPVPLSTSNV